ncbi:MAG: HAD hydrolase family protein [Planctomycetes bacterium]|jgi:3-deoxy-D-manno-octulosonate 8-phosphate phosphatase (KDO 8-P phosphatase)|nr:HAD hydrolase family protein [Planctomycetota bacterium]
MNIKNIITDVDGVLTTGKFLYSSNGKKFKIFGPHDADGIKILKNAGIHISAISADKRGYDITAARMSDMNIPLDLISEHDRFTFVSNEFDLTKIAFVGDGLFDSKLLRSAALGFAPNDATNVAKKAATFVTPSKGGCGVFLDIALWFIKNIFDEPQKESTKLLLNYSDLEFSNFIDSLWGYQR